MQTQRLQRLRYLTGGVLNRQTPFALPLAMPVLAFTMGFHRTWRRRVKAIQPSS